MTHDEMISKARDAVSSESTRARYEEYKQKLRGRTLTEEQIRESTISFAMGQLMLQHDWKLDVDETRALVLAAMEKYKNFL